MPDRTAGTKGVCSQGFQVIHGGRRLDNNALKRTKRPRGATVARRVAPRAHSRTGRFTA